MSPQPAREVSHSAPASYFRVGRRDAGWAIVVQRDDVIVETINCTSRPEVNRHHNPLIASGTPGVMAEWSRK
jgi:hypothetical protein